MVADAINCMTMNSVYNIEESNNDLVRGVHRLAKLGVRLKDYLNGGFVVHHNSN